MIIANNTRPYCNCTGPFYGIVTDINLLYIVISLSKSFLSYIKLVFDANSNDILEFSFFYLFIIIFIATVTRCG